MAQNKSKLTHISLFGIIQVIATFTTVLSLLTLFDGLHRYLELFSHFKLQYFIASVTCAILFGFYKNYKVAFILLLTALLNSVFIIPWYVSDQQNTSTEVQVELSLLHSNVHSSNQQFDKFIELIQQQNPDVFVMQEVNQRWLSAIKPLEMIYPHNHTIPRGDNFGIAIFSKLPLQSMKVIDSGPFEIPTLIAELSIKGQLVTIIATHPLPPVNKEYYHSRNSQINKIAEMSRNHQEPLIVIGDLNVSMWSKDYKPLEQETHLRNARKDFGLLPTWPAQFRLPIFMIPIDHVLVSSHFVVNEIKVGANIGSDHLPLIVRLGIKGLE